MRSDALDWRFPDQLRFIRHDASPEVDADEPGVALALSEPALGESTVGFVLHVTLGLDAELFYSFKRAVHAIVVTVEEIDSGRAAAFRLVDPDIDYLRPMWPNFTGWSGVESNVFARGWVNAPLQLRIAARPSHPGVWVQAHFRQFHSKRIHLRFDES